jgi:hypothetical protein
MAKKGLGGRLKNLGRSIAFGSIEMLEDYNPAITKLHQTNKEYAQSVRDVLRDLYRGQMSIAKTLDRINPQLAKSYGLIKDGIAGTLEDATHTFKTGEVRGLTGKGEESAAQELLQKAGFDKSDLELGFDDSDFSMDDLNWDDLDTKPSKSDASDIQDVGLAKATAAEVAAINKGTEVTAMVGAKLASSLSNVTSSIGSQTKALSGEFQRANKINVKIANSLVMANASMVNKMQGTLKMINDNLANMISFNNDTNLKYAQASMEYYDKSLEELSKIRAAVERGFPEAKKRESNFLDSDYTDLGLEEGTIDLGKYLGVAMKNFTEQTDIGMLLKTGYDTFINNPEVIVEMFQNPMKSITKFAIENVVPNVLKETMLHFNLTLQEFIPAAVAKLADMGDRSDNPFLQMVGNIFGIRVEKKAFDLKNYEKGPVPFDGVTRKAIVDTIPTLLTKIHSALTGAPERHMNYETGRWETTDEIRQRFRGGRREARRMALGESGEYIDKLRDVIIADSKEQREQIDSAINVMKEYLAGGHGNEFSFNNFNDQEFLDTMSSAISEAMGGVWDKYNTDVTRGLVEAFSKHMHTLEKVRPDLAMRVGGAKALANTYINRGIDQEAMNPNSMYAKLFSGWDDRTSRRDLERIRRFKNDRRFSGEAGYSFAFDNGMLPYPMMMMGGGMGMPPSGNIQDWLKQQNQFRKQYESQWEENPFGGTITRNRKYDRVRGGEMGYMRGMPWSEELARLNPRERQLLQQELDEEEMYRLRSGTDKEQEEFRRRRDMQRAQRMHDRDVVRAGRKSGQISLGITSSDSMMMADAFDNRWRKKTHEDDRKKWQAYIKKYVNGENPEDLVDEWDTEDRDSILYRWIKKPSEIISDALTSVEHSMYTVLFGTPENAEESVIEVLAGNIKGVFTEVREWVGKEVFNPLKRLIFGDDAMDTVSDMAKKGYNFISATGLYQETLSELHNIVDDTVKTAADYFKDIHNDFAPEFKIHAPSTTANDVARAQYQDMYNKYRNSVLGGQNIDFAEWLSANAAAEGLDQEDQADILAVDAQGGHRSAGGFIHQMGNYILSPGELVIPKEYAQKVYASLKGLGIKSFTPGGMKGSFSGPSMQNALGGLFGDAKGGVAGEEGAYAAKAFQGLITALYTLTGVIGKSVEVQEETNALAGGKLAKNGSYASRLTRLIAKTEKKTDARSIARLEALRGKRAELIQSYGVRNEKYGRWIGDLESQLEGSGSYLDMTDEEKAEYNKKKKRLDLLKMAQSRLMGRKSLLEKSQLAETEKKPTVEGAKQTIQEGAKTAFDKLSTGFGQMVGILTGDSDWNKKEVLDETSKAFRKAMPKTLAQTIAGTVGLTALGSHLGVLGMLIGPGGPIGAALISGALSIAHQSDTFKDLVYGKLDASDGKRYGGLIPDALKDFFRENKTGLLGGALMGGIGAVTGLGPLQLAGSLLGSLPGAGVIGFLPQMALGITGPVIAGGAIGAAIHSKKFRQIVFGSFDADGNKISEDLIDKVKDALPRGIAGAGIGALAAGAASSLGVLGALAIGPWTGAVIGGALGLATAADNFGEWWFGKKDAQGTLQKAGMFQIAKGFLDVEVFQPMKSFLQKRWAGLVHWTEQAIMYPLAEAFAPVKAFGLTIKDTIVDMFKNVGNRIYEALSPVLDPIKKFVSFVAEGAKNTIRRIFDIGTTVLGGIISAPFKLLGIGGNLMSGSMRLLNSKYSANLAIRKQQIEAGRAASDLKYQMAMDEYDLNEQERLGKQAWAREHGYGAYEVIKDQIAANEKHNEELRAQAEKAADDQSKRDEKRDNLLITTNKTLEEIKNSLVGNKLKSFKGLGRRKKTKAEAIANPTDLAAQLEEQQVAEQSGTYTPFSWEAIKSGILPFRGGRAFGGKIKKAGLYLLSKGEEVIANRTEQRHKDAVNEAKEIIERDKDITKTYGRRTFDVINAEKKEDAYKSGVLQHLTSMNERLGVISKNTGQKRETVWDKIKSFFGGIWDFLKNGFGFAADIAKIASGVVLLGGIAKSIYDFITGRGPGSGNTNYHEDQIHTQVAHRVAESQLGKYAINRGLRAGSRIGKTFGNWGKSFGQEARDIARMRGGRTATEVIDRNADEVFDLGKALRASSNGADEIVEHGGRAAKEIAEEGIEHADDIVGRFKKVVSEGFEKLAKSKTLRNLLGIGAMESFCNILRTTLTKIRWGERAIKKKLLAKLGGGLAGKAAKGVMNTLIAHTGVGLLVTGGFAAYDAARGFADAGQMFGIRAEDVTMPMRKACAIYNAIAGLPYIWAIDLALELVFPSGKQALVKMFYQALGYGSIQEIDQLEAKAKEEFAKWEQQEGNQGKSFEDYLKESQEGYTPIMDAIRNSFGPAGQMLAGKKGENGKLQEHGLLTALESTWDDTSWYQMPFAIPKLVAGTARRWLFGDNANGVFTKGVLSDTLVGKAVNNTLAFIFGEAANEDFESTNGIIGNWAKRISDVWDTGLVQSLEEFQETVRNQYAEHGALHGTFNIITNGLFGISMDSDPWKKLSSTLSDLANSIGNAFNEFSEKVSAFLKRPVADILKDIGVSIWDFVKPDTSTGAVEQAKTEAKSELDAMRYDPSAEDTDTYTSRYNKYLELTTTSAINDEWTTYAAEHAENKNPGEANPEFKEWKRQRALRIAKELNLEYEEQDGKIRVFSARRGGDVQVGGVEPEDRGGAFDGFGGIFNQRDKRWATKPVGPSQYGNMGDIGCGPTALATALSMEGKSGVTPEDTLRQVRPEDLGTASRGVTGSYFPKAAHAMGSEFYPINPTDPKAVGKALKSGYPVIAGGKSGNAGPFTQAGHWNVFRGLGKGGITQSFDPLGRRRPGAPVSVGSVMGGVAGARGGMMGVIAPKGKSGFGGNTMKMYAQQGADCTLHSTAAMENAYLGTNYDSTNFDFDTWYGSLAEDLQVSEEPFDVNEGPRFVSYLEGHFGKHPEWPIMLYQTGGDGSNGGHEINRGSGDHATVIGRKLPSGKYEVYDSNEGVVHTLEAGEIFDPTARGGYDAYHYGRTGIPAGEGNTLYIPGIAPSEPITTWTATGGPYEGGPGSGSERVAMQRANPSGVANKPKYMSLMDKLRALGGKFSNLGKAYMEARLTDGDLNTIYNELEANNSNNTATGGSSAASIATPAPGAGPAPGKGIENIPSTAPSWTIPMAERASKVSGIPADWIWAQWANEAGPNFDSDLARENNNYAGMTVPESMPGTWDRQYHWGKWDTNEDFADYFGRIMLKWDDPAATSAKTMYEYVNNIQNQSDGSMYCGDPPGTEPYYNAMISRLGNTGTDLRSGMSGWYGDGLYGLGGSLDMQHDMPYNTPSLDVDDFAHTYMLDAIRSLDIHREANEMIKILTMIHADLKEGVGGDTVTVGNQKMTRAEANALKHPPQLSATNGINGRRFNSATYESIHAKNMEIAAGGEFASA